MNSRNRNLLCFLLVLLTCAPAGKAQNTGDCQFNLRFDVGVQEVPLGSSEAQLNSDPRFKKLPPDHPAFAKLPPGVPDYGTYKYRDVYVTLNSEKKVWSVGFLDASLLCLNSKPLGNYTADELLAELRKVDTSVRMFDANGEYDAYIDTASDKVGSLFLFKDGKPIGASLTDVVNDF